MNNVEWLEAHPQVNGIETIALQDMYRSTINSGRIVGYNGILKGDKVVYKDKECFVVMVSRLGHFGLSLTGRLPYTETVYPGEVIKVQGGIV